MKNFPLLLFLSLFLGFAVSAQTSQSSNCPTFDVSSEGIAKPGDIITFTARFENYDLKKLSFSWAVVGGEISEGDGTFSIKVLAGGGGENVTAAVEIIGLPESCEKTDSETAAPWCPPSARLIDEFSARPSLFIKERLENLVTELQNHPGANIFIIEYFKPNTPQNLIDLKIQKITDYLLYEKQLPKERFTILKAESEGGQHRTKFWIVPPGAYNPQP